MLTQARPACCRECGAPVWDEGDALFDDQARVWVGIVNCLRCGAGFIYLEAEDGEDAADDA